MEKIWTVHVEGDFSSAASFDNKQDAIEEANQIACIEGSKRGSQNRGVYLMESIAFFNVDDISVTRTPTI